MKNLIWALILMPLASIAQSIQIDSFCGVKFGSSKDNAIQAFKGQGAFVNVVDEVEELIHLSNLTVEGVTSKAAYLKFVDNRLYEGIAEFDVDESNFLLNFDRLKLGLSKKFGYGKDFSWFEPPYFRGDGQEYQALKNKNAKLCHVWARSKQVTSDDFIILEMGADRVLRVVFQDHEFATLASQKFRQLKAKN